MKERGYFNAYLHNGDIDFDRQQEFLLSHSFDAVHGRQELQTAFAEKMLGSCPRSSWGIHDEYLMRYAKDFLGRKEKEGKPCFLYLFTISNHHPWRLPQGAVKHSFLTPEGVSEAPFLQTMHYSDHWMGWFIEQLRVQGLLEKSLVFIFGDHGQPLGEHGAKFQQREAIYEEGVRVPLLLLGKGMHPQVIDEVAGHIDLLPTLLDTLDIGGVHHSIGRSLRRQQEESEARFFTPFFPTTLGCRKERWKFIHNPVSGEDELFDIWKDPGETVNLAQTQAGVATAMRSRVLGERSLFEELYRKKAFFPCQQFGQQFGQ